MKNHPITDRDLNRFLAEHPHIKVVSERRISSYYARGGFAGGKRSDLNDMFFRSSWEANYARYLNFLKGLGEIQGWEYEKEEFKFPGITRGNMYYLTDFKVITKKGLIEFHEIKGWMDKASKTKLKRMAKYFPNTKVILIEKEQYNEISKQMKNLIPNWENRKSRAKAGI